MHEEEMTLRELLGTICARWRMLLVVAVAFALILGGCRTYSRLQSIGDEDTTETALQANRIEQQLYDDQKAQLLAQIDQLTTQEEQAAAYNENSLLMKVDPYDKEVAKIAFSVNVDMDALAREVPQAWQIPTSVDLKANREERIVNQYEVLANGVSLSELMTDTPYVKIGDQYLRELVSISNDGQGILIIEALTTDKLDGMELAERLYAYCQERQTAVVEAAGAHTIELVDACSVTQIDLSLGDTQRRAQSCPSDIAVQIAAKTKELEELVEPATVAPASLAGAIKSGIKYAVLGACVGACIGAVIAFFMETMGVYCKNGATLARATASRYLGNLKPYSRKRGLDAWAEALLGADIFSMVATEDRLPLLAANLKEAVGGKRRLLITGMHAQTELELLADELQKQLGDGYQLIAAANLLINAEAIQQLKNVDGVVIVENEKSAQIERVLKTKQYLDEAKVSLVGVVWA